MQSMKKRWLVNVAAALAFTGILAGCGSKKDEKTILDVVWFSDAGEGESFMKLSQEYMELHPDIEIKLIEVPYGDLDNKLKNMINGGEAPALARMTNLGPFQSQLLDLGQYLPDKEAFVNRFGSGLKFVYDDKILGAPLDLGSNGVIYNKTAFEKAGVSVPQSEDEIWTWDEWKEAMKTVMEKGDVKYGLVFDYTAQRFTTLLYQAGGSLLNEDMTKSNINTEETRRAVSFFKELHDEEIIPSTVWLGSENPNNLFRSGQVAMHIGGTWLVTNYKDEITDFEWGVTYLPKEAERATVPGGKWLCGFQNTGVEQETADFIQWMTEKENNALYCRENNFLSQVVGNEDLDYEYGKEFFNVFAQDLAAVGPTPGREWSYQAFTGSISTEMRDGIANVLADKITVDEFVEKMDVLFNDTLKELNEE